MQTSGAYSHTKATCEWLSVAEQVKQMFEVQDTESLLPTLSQTIEKLKSLTHENLVSAHLTS
jgi:hypothetical protein